VPTTVLTLAAQRRQRLDLAHLDGVADRPELRRDGVTRDTVAAHLAAGRWRRIGSAIVLHNGPLTAAQRETVVLINCGPRAVLTSFTAARRWGLRGWERPEIHVLAPAGTARPRLRGLVLHRTGDWSAVQTAHVPRLHRLAPAVLLAAASFPASRPGCAILAAIVQQCLAGASDLRAALDAAPRLRHRAALVLAVEDIAQGAQALSEIDFGRLCKRHRLPPPSRQAVRVEPNGRRRYLDAEWDLPDGRRVAVEVDGAVHLEVQQWVHDQLRQNNVVLGGTIVLRYPSVVVRDAPDVVAAQLHRALLAPARSPRS
jgi:hypothetical protein